MCAVSLFAMHCDFYSYVSSIDVDTVLSTAEGCQFCCSSFVGFDLARVQRRMWTKLDKAMFYCPTTTVRLVSVLNVIRLMADHRSKVGMEASRSPECPSFTYATREEKPPTTEQVGEKMLVLFGSTCAQPP